jgi:hypothetical protein
MTEVQALFLILAAIYLLQCVVWLPRDCVVFRRGLRGRWNLADDGISLEALKLKGVVVNPLPPLPEVIACEPERISLSPSGIATLPVSAGALPQHLAFLSFDEITSVSTQEKMLMVNDAAFAVFQSAAAARDAAGAIGKLAKMSAGKREKVLTAGIRAKFDSQAITDRLDQGRQATSLLRFSCNLLFVLLFALAPLIVWRRTLAASWPYLLAVLVCYMAVITWEFVRAHKALYPDAKDQRFTDALSVALSPAGALRATDPLLKDLLREFHPVAVARLLCRPATFEAFASQTLRELAFPRRPDTESEVEQTRLWWQHAQLAALKSFLLKSGIDPAQWLAAPVRDPECRSFCQRCWSQFVQCEGICPECGDLALLTFADKTIGDQVPAS